jgi:aryl-alcohol dehydrogenase-like predicted oxidoreductase
MIVGAQKLGLGTVQFGMNYGISNPKAPTPNAEMTAILARCRDAGVNNLDTAAAYGDAEERLGAMLPVDWMPRIVTKMLPLSEGITRVEHGLHTSLARLGRKNVYGLLVHRAEDLLGDSGPDLWRLLQRWRDDGRVEKIGVSVYTAEQTDNLLRRYPLQIVQIPTSLLDQRLVCDGTAERLKQAGVEIHVRSVFLQGLVFLAGEQLPPGFAFARTTLDQVQAWLKEAGTTPLQAALAYVLSRPEFDVVLVGVNSRGELDAILHAVTSPPPDLDWDRFALADERILNPTLWTTQ